MAPNEAPSANRSRNAKESEPPGAFLRLGPSSVIAIVFLATAAIALAYIGGVMSGRHGGDGRQPVTATESAQAPLPDKGSPADGQAENKILAAEDLEFARVLRNESPKKNVDVAKPEAATQPAPEQRPASPGAEAAGESPPTKPAENPDAIHDYIFQMGAFRDEASADGLRQSLEGHGLRTKLERSGKLYVVLALLRGNAARAAEVLEIARKLKLGEPLTRVRKPVAP